MVAYSLCDVINDHGAVGISVVHRSKRLVSLLASGIPYLELHGGVLIEGDGLSEESGTDSGFPKRVELILGAKTLAPFLP